MWPEDLWGARGAGLRSKAPVATALKSQNQLSVAEALQRCQLSCGALELRSYATVIRALSPTHAHLPQVAGNMCVPQQHQHQHHGPSFAGKHSQTTDPQKCCWLPCFWFRQPKKIEENSFAGQSATGRSVKIITKVSLIKSWCWK